MACKTIDDQFWNDPDIFELKADEKLLLIFLMTNQYAHHTGIYYLPMSLIKEEIGTSIRNIENVMKGLSLRNLIEYDYSARIVWVKKIQLQKNFSNSQKEGLKRYFGKISHSNLLIKFLHFHKLNDMIKYFVKSENSEDDELQYLGPIDPDSLPYSQECEDFHGPISAGAGNFIGMMAAYWEESSLEFADSFKPPVAEVVNRAGVSYSDLDGDSESGIYMGMDTSMDRGIDRGIHTPMDRGINGIDSEDMIGKKINSNILINDNFGAFDDTPMDGGMDRGIATPMPRGSEASEKEKLSIIKINDEGQKNGGLYIYNNNINSKDNNNIYTENQKKTAELKNKSRGAAMKGKEKKDEKKQFAEFVFLKEEEYHKLIKAHGKEAVNKMIEILNTYKGAHGRKYKSDYMAILNWVVDAYKKKEEEQKKGKLVKGHYYDYDTPWQVEYF